MAPVMSDEKEGEFKDNILQTISGIHKDNLSLHRVEELLILFPLTFILPLLVQNTAIAIAVPTILNLTFNLVEDLLRERPLRLGRIIVRNLMLGMFTLLWTSHLFFLVQDNSNEPYNIVLSAISILTSIYTIARLPVKEISANGF